MNSEVQIFKALADDTRLKIILLLCAGELCVCEIMAALDLPQSTVSRHLAYLRNSGWISGRRQSNWMYYRLRENNHTLVDALLPLLKDHLASAAEVSAALTRLTAFQTTQAEQNNLCGETQ